jgi:hypothetical protein
MVFVLVFNVFDTYIVDNNKISLLLPDEEEKEDK